MFVKQSSAWLYCLLTMYSTKTNHCLHNLNYKWKQNNGFGNRDTFVRRSNTSRFVKLLYYNQRYHDGRRQMVALHYLSIYCSLW
jgi:hypothetical protein